MTKLHVERWGSGPTVLLVHGSVFPGAATWAEQRPLAGRWTLVVPDRPGYGRTAANGRPGFDRDAPLVAELFGERAHVVGHSYGGVVSLLAAALRPEAVASLTVIEPPAYAVARGDPKVDRVVDRLAKHWDSGPQDPGEFLRGFLRVVGSAYEPPSPLPPRLKDGAETLRAERSPAEAEIPLDELADAPFPKLVISGGHDEAFDAVCDVLEERLAAERVVISGAGHSVQRTGAPFNDRLEVFLDRAESL